METVQYPRRSVAARPAYRFEGVSTSLLLPFSLTMKVQIRKLINHKFGINQRRVRLKNIKKVLQ